MITPIYSLSPEAPKMRSVMTHQFSRVPKANIQRSSFDRSHGYKTTFNAGGLYPIFIDEALPGDTFNCKLTAFARMATPIYPIMDNLYMETFFFAVPNRLVWENWEKFNGAQEDPDSSIDFTVPQLALGTTAELSIYDYMGFPLAGQLQGSALPLRCYNLIWNEWFRDQNLQDSVTVRTDDGTDIRSLYDILPRGKRHDYFTSSLPWPQKGDSVDIPLGQVAPLITDVDAGTDDIVVRRNAATAVDDGVRFGAGAAFATIAGNVTAEPNLFADLSEATASTINQLRQAFQIQKILERDARGGTRYVELIKSHFGVTSPDYRLQRPEFLGGGSSPINVTTVPQTSETNTTPQGSLSAYATASLSGHGFTKSFTEHCTLIGLVNVRADLTYQQGRDRMWFRETRYDFYLPALAHIGEQAVLNREIFEFGSGASYDTDVWGYQGRFDEYRYKPSMITGQFRSANSSSLDAWHLSQEFDPILGPELGPDFIEDDPPMDRVLAVPSEPDFIFDAFFSMRCARPMPLYGTPGQIDRF